MDPEIVLKRIRQLTRRILESDDYVNTASTAYELAEKVQALDEWISKGGLLPEDWADL